MFALCFSSTSNAFAGTSTLNHAYVAYGTGTLNEVRSKLDNIFWS